MKNVIFDGTVKPKEEVKEEKIEKEEKNEEEDDDDMDDFVAFGKKK